MLVLCCCLSAGCLEDGAVGGGEGACSVGILRCAGLICSGCLHFCLGWCRGGWRPGQVVRVYMVMRERSCVAWRY